MKSHQPPETPIGLVIARYPLAAFDIVREEQGHGGGIRCYGRAMRVVKVRVWNLRGSGDLVPGFVRISFFQQELENCPAHMCI